MESSTDPVCQSDPSEPAGIVHAYDDADSAVWRLAVYDAVHDGWGFACIGGRRVLDHLGTSVPLTPVSRVLELCCGMGDTCRYLVRTYGCHVTGVDINARQIERARKRAELEDDSAAHRLTYVEADVCDVRWSADFDAVFTLDSLMLVPELTRALAVARRALLPGGTAVFAEMVAGREAREEDREYAAREDGIVNLPTSSEYMALLVAAGFTQCECVDLTPLATACFDRIHAALCQRSHEIVQRSGRRVHEGWLALSATYAERFRERRYEYALLTARAGS